MAIADARLNVIAFPQRWDGAELSLRVLVLPKGDPRAPLFPGASPFAESVMQLRARVIPGLERMPDPADALPANGSFAATPAGIADMFDALAATFNINPALTGNPRPANTRFKKYLTRSYQRAFAFDGPSRDFVFTNDAYECALKDPTTTHRPPRPSPPNEMSWGRTISYAIRQPRLARALGLLMEGEIALPDPNPFAQGGWLYVDLDPAGGLGQALAGQPAMLGLFAARIPPLTIPRALFAAVSFPVASGTTGSFDEQFLEAENYDDGFAKIVHGSQPEHGAILETEHNAHPAVKDVGIRLGWDDEQIAIWLNRQIDATLITPMGVSGYRVDVRKPGSAKWHSLVRAEGIVKLAEMSLGYFDDEFTVEAVPLQLHAERTGDYWLPSYFTTWSGSSLVITNLTALKLAKREAGPKRAFAVPNEAQIPPLRYGERYEFRVRLADLARGGPESRDTRINPAPAPEATIEFRRFAPPKGVVIERHPAQLIDEPLSVFRVSRPRLGFPDAVFAGVANAEDMLLADLPAAGEDERETGLPDPDVIGVEITVEVLLPPNVEEGGRGQQFIPLYTTLREFSADPASGLDLQVIYQDVPNLTPLTAAQPLEATVGSGPITVPSAREARLRLVAVCKADPELDYFGTESARRSAVPVFVELRAPSRNERQLFLPQAQTRQIQAIFLLPDPSAEASHAADRLARQLSLANTGLTLTGLSGKRTVFGCSGAIRHTLTPDRSAITFASASDLLRQWIVAIRVEINRDWSWSALTLPAFTIERDGQPVGALDMPRGISRLALPGNRNVTDLVFFHAIDPKPLAGATPTEIHTRYTLEPHFLDAPVEQDAPLGWSLRLPVAFPPTQTPRLVSAGIALSPYEAAADYSSTAPRQRMLWLELDSPPVDGNDRYFVRALAYAPDPLLMRDDESIPEPGELPLPIDAEPIRIITPGQPADEAGLNAMRELLHVTEPGGATRALVPLPDGLGPDSPELFGFFTYEIRLGHDASRWSTAQGRFGPPLRVTGVQHPAPGLFCQVSRAEDGVHVAAPYATPVLEGRNLRPLTPNTEIWVLLYVQVTQVDGAGRRNVLLERARGRPAPTPELGDRLHGEHRLLMSEARFDQATIHERLVALGLPNDSALAILAVELLPEPQVQRFADPLGGDLGHVRILRTSPLQPVPTIC